MILIAGLILAAASVAMSAPPPDQWIHVRVISADAKGESVRVNIPMSFAEKIIPTICAKRFHEGRVKIDGQINYFLDCKCCTLHIIRLSAYTISTIEDAMIGK